MAKRSHPTAREKARQGERKSKPVRQHAPPSKHRAHGCLRQLLLSVLLVIILVLVIPAGHVAVVWRVNPSFTPMMAQRWLEARLSGHKPVPIRHQWIPIEDVPPVFLRMVLSVEDARFFQHDGFDWIEIDAVWRDFREKGKPLRGASTVSMQCARTVFLWQDRTLLRKVFEAYVTVLSERLMGKRRILELYVNLVEMGDGIYGLGAASEYFFHKSANELDTHQLASLAAVLPAPRAWNPTKPSPALQRRIRRVLTRWQSMHLPKDFYSNQ